MISASTSPFARSRSKRDNPMNEALGRVLRWMIVTPAGVTGLLTALAVLAGLVWFIKWKDER